MRQIIIKYNGDCKYCGKTLEIGEQAMYEKSMGCFCLGCEPKDTEEIRHYRQIKADKKAERLNTWADKREAEADRQLNSYPEIRHDTAFNTQPGYIPFRARMNRADDRAYESLRKAQGMRSKAESLNHVQVKGDAAAKWEQARLNVLEWLRVGDVVDCGYAAPVTILKINQKTARIKTQFGEGIRELIYFSKVKEREVRK